MKILMVVALVSPYNEYGGPLRVAVNQSKALLELGHDVTIAGAYRGYNSAPSEVEGVPALLFPACNIVPRSGFAGLASPRLWRWFAGLGSQFDVVHIHAARDLVTLPIAGIAALQRKHYVIQPHGMIDVSDRVMAKPLDTLLTIPALSRAGRVFYLTEKERTDISCVMRSRHVTLTELPNGVPRTDCAAQRAANHRREVLYMARLASRKRPTMFVQAAEALSLEFPEIKFTLVGPDEGEGDAVSRRIHQSAVGGTAITWEGPIPSAETIERMSRAAMYVLPAIDEPYPMAVLEAMSVGLPVIVTQSCGLAEFIRKTRSGIAIDHEIDSLIGAMRKLLADPELAHTMGDSGRVAVREQRSMSAIANSLECAYFS